MKVLFIGLLAALGSLSSHALTLNEVIEALPAAVSIQDAKVNLDGSVTFKDIKVQRGDQSYRLTHSNSFKSVCKLLDYDNVLSGEKINKKVYTSSGRYPMVLLTESGRFSNTVLSNDYIGKVTCYSGSVRQVVDFDMNENSDGSSSITKIVYKRGDQSFKLVHSNSFKSVCSLLGYEEVLTGANLNVKVFTSSGRYPMISLAESGSYYNMVYANDYIGKVTCYSGETPDLIVLINGNRYRKL